ncbi:FecR family protein [Chitinophaga pinensis]|uniref:Anti-FecI sigma factor, FecR n=1 Tax=Chitinophaga pinensis (strain ATCC 43595 / DSM 2588 / LMG 13176 / NBRC 15968 / NCIMB 11800 / UQM 2034) TaxID=485918 RepID=A0A979GTK5_CHIPD|nr:FecR family protein [Chitinophaga pinensis]ACU60154.1 anti-FecI sigma factor, FecR [Chitinophaga pinensis DSM 2588]
MYNSGKDQQYFFKLLSRYNEGKVTPEEAAFVDRYLELLDYREKDVLKDFDQQKVQIAASMQERLLESIRHEPVVNRIYPVRRWLTAAAAVLLLLGSGYYFFERQHTPAKHQTAQHTDILPGKTGAILTLADGSKIVLDSSRNGVIAMQGNTTIQLNNGKIRYNKGGHESSPASKPVGYNTITTPRGRQYQLVLPDGTSVWLNAASSLSYPTDFNGKERRVRVSGEAYFEVASNASQPFIVTVNDATTIQVLGTKFNINAYKDESSINTTLLQGAVKVTYRKASQLLKPGQAAQISQELRLIPTADVNGVIAWKEGVFAFNNADLPTVMRQLARWYDIEVSYEGSVSAATFTGEIDKSLTLSQVLQGLTATSINYKIEGNRLIIIQH